ncbi:hypothetical protein D3C81_1024720 [compost metagenome]
MGVDHLDLDTELLELDLQQTRHALQRLRREAGGLDLRRIEQGQRRQGARYRVINVVHHGLGRIDRAPDLGRLDLDDRALLRPRDCRLDLRAGLLALTAWPCRRHRTQCVRHRLGNGSEHRLDLGRLRHRLRLRVRLVVNRRQVEHGLDALSGRRGRTHRDRRRDACQHSPGDGRSRPLRRRLRRRGTGCRAWPPGYRFRRGLDRLVRLSQLQLQLTMRLATLPPAVAGALNQLEQVKGDLAGKVHDPEPRQIGEHGQPEEEQRDEHQRAALHIQGILGPLAETLAKNPAGRRLRIHFQRLELNRSQGGRRGQQEEQADDPPGKQPAIPAERLMARAEQLENLDTHQQRQQVGRIAEAEQEETGHPGPYPPGRILHLARTGGDIDARIHRGVAQQSHPEIDAQRPQRNQRRFLQTVMQLLAQGIGFGGIGRALQNVFFLR